MMFLLNIATLSVFPTKKQACNPTEEGPGDVLRGADVLHMCEI